MNIPVGHTAADAKLPGMADVILDDFLKQNMLELVTKRAMPTTTGIACLSYVAKDKPRKACPGCNGLSKIRGRVYITGNGHLFNLHVSGQSNPETFKMFLTSLRRNGSPVH